MTADKQNVERRSHQRFQVPKGVFVEVRRPHHSKLGEIINISMGGVAFRYLAAKEPSNGSDKLNIFFDEGGFRLNDILLETVTDLRTHKIPYTYVTMRRSGVQFSSLTHHQISQLEHFIENYAIGEA
jgi:hypothetical protein